MADGMPEDMTMEDAAAPVVEPAKASAPVSVPKVKEDPVASSRLPT